MTADLVRSETGKSMTEAPIVFAIGVVRQHSTLATIPFLGFDHRIEERKVVGAWLTTALMFDEAIQEIAVSSETC